MPAGMLVLLVCAGCESVSRLTLTQPRMHGRQRHLDLRSAQTCWAGESGVERILSELPLPGATSGRPMFVLYLRVTPALINGSKRPPGDYAVRGFLVQTRGEYAGRVDVRGGRITPARLTGRRHDVDLDLELEDGSRIFGRLVARRNDRRLGDFEIEQRAGDVQSLLVPAE